MAVSVLAFGLGGCTSGSSPAPAPPATSTTASTSAATTATPSSNQAGADGEQVARSAAASAAAAAFMRAFARPDLPEAAWWARLAPLLTETGRMAAEGTDPALIPVRSVTGAARVLPGAERDARTVTVPTDIGDYTLFLVYDAGSSRWLVQTYQPPPGVK